MPRLHRADYRNGINKFIKNWIMAKLSIRNNVENLEKVAEFVSGFSSDRGLPDKFVFEMNLVLDELVTNVITYGYSDKEPHKIDIEIDLMDDEVVMTISDDGDEFNPLDHEVQGRDASLRERPVGGLGIFFVKEKTDELSYVRENGKNIVTLKKFIKQKEDKNED